MQFISFQRAGQPGYGVLTPHGIVDLGARLGGTDIAQALRRLGADALLTAAQRITPDFPASGSHGITSWRPAVADPHQIFCVGLNYEEHRVEAKRPATVRPTIFLRLPSSQTGHLEPLLRPTESQAFDFEGEIAVVIGRGGRRIPAEKAWEHIFGLGCYNDGSVRDWQAHTSQWAPGKNFPGTGAFGPVVVDRDAIGENTVLSLTTRLNGQIMQQATTDMLLFPIPELIAYISTFCTLQTGDVIVTGTPGGVGFKRKPPVFMKSGDVVEVEVPGLGLLSNPVRDEAPQQVNA